MKSSKFDKGKKYLVSHTLALCSMVLTMTTDSYFAGLPGFGLGLGCFLLFFMAGFVGDVDVSKKNGFKICKIQLKSA